MTIALKTSINLLKAAESTFFSIVCAACCYGDRYIAVLMLTYLRMYKMYIVLDYFEFKKL